VKRLELDLYTELAVANIELFIKKFRITVLMINGYYDIDQLESGIRSRYIKGETPEVKA